jgi:hypothetical protein
MEESLCSQTIGAVRGNIRSLEMKVSAKKTRQVFQMAFCDFAKVTPSNIFKIFKTPACGGDNIGDILIESRPCVPYWDKFRFKQEFPFVYLIDVVTPHLNRQGRTFTMNEEGKVESYEEVFDNFALYLHHVMMDSYLSGSQRCYERLIFERVEDEQVFKSAFLPCS